MGKSRTVSGSIVVVAKCPIPGKSKTRLIPLTGVDGSAQIATAMLADVLTSLTLLETKNSIDRILLYAPPTQAGRMTMESLLDRFSIPRQEHTEEDVNSSSSGESCSERSHGNKSRHRRTRKDRSQRWNPDAWTLLPMSNQKIDENGRPLQEDSESSINLRGAYLSDILENALHRSRIRLQGFRSNGPVLFVGMDSPEIPLDEIAYALEDAKRARLCPSEDGGYGLLSVPAHASAHAVFEGVRWSDPQTSVSQLKALTDLNIHVSLGRLMHDIDEPADVVELVDRLHKHDSRLESGEEAEEGVDVLTRSPPSMTIRQRKTGSCLFTRQALQDLQLWGPGGELLRRKSAKVQRYSNTRVGTGPTVSTSFSSEGEYNVGAEVVLENLGPDMYADDFAEVNQLNGSASYSL